MIADFSGGGFTAERAGKFRIVDVASLPAWRRAVVCSSQGPGIACTAAPRRPRDPVFTRFSCAFLPWFRAAVDRFPRCPSWLNFILLRSARHARTSGRLRSASALVRSARSFSRLRVGAPDHTFGFRFKTGELQLQTGFFTPARFARTQIRFPSGCVFCNPVTCGENLSRIADIMGPSPGTSAARLGAWRRPCQLNWRAARAFCRLLSQRLHFLRREPTG